MFRFRPRQSSFQTKSWSNLHWGWGNVIFSKIVWESVRGLQVTFFDGFGLSMSRCSDKDDSSHTRVIIQRNQLRGSDSNFLSSTHNDCWTAICGLFSRLYIIARISSRPQWCPHFRYLLSITRKGSQSKFLSWPTLENCIFPWTLR
jgi:hypothetical protein